jgi:nucleoside 2-deoxyribosyltransferase
MRSVGVPLSGGPAGSTDEGSFPRIYFARAIDGQGKKAGQALTYRVAKELADVGLLMVDPTVNEPTTTANGRSLKQAEKYQAIVEHDLSILRSCDAVLMDISEPGRSYIGCICELTYAYLWQIPCVVYLGGCDKNRPWLHYHASAIYAARDDAVMWLARRFNNNALAWADGRKEQRTDSPIVGILPACACRLSADWQGRGDKCQG